MPAEPATGDLPLNWTSSTEQAAEALVVCLAGELDYPGVPQLEVLLSEALDTAPATLVLDLADVVFCDSSSLQVLLRISTRAAEQGTGFALARARRAVTRPIQVLGLSAHLPAFESVDAAVAAR
jgi:anti-sigma B factor antagonist